MQGTMNDNSSSLSLALGARMAINALYALQKGGRANEALKKEVRDVTKSLKALSTPGKPLFAHLSSSSSFESFDQIQTLQEVKSAFPRENVEEKLELAIDASDSELQRQGVEFAIIFFSALERQARQKFNQPVGFGI
jgi:biopolymer transport protein ExbB/TolQ